MDKYLKASAIRFEEMKDKDYLINPMSTKDAEIIIEIREALKKLGATDLVDILRQYKFRKDEEICDNLLQWNTDFAGLGNNDPLEEIAKEYREQNKKEAFKYLLIDDILIKSHHLHGVKIVDEWDEKRGDYLFCIILNPLPPEEIGQIKLIPLYANEKLVFYREEDRDEVLANIRNFLEEEGNDIIIIR